MNLNKLAQRARRPFWRPSWNPPLPITFFHPENDFNGFLDPKNLAIDTKFITLEQIHWALGYIGYKGAAAILDAMLNFTFLPHIWNVYPSFFNFLWVPYTDQESKLGDIWLHSAPWLFPQLEQLACVCYLFSFWIACFLCYHYEQPAVMSKS